MVLTFTYVDTSTGMRDPPFFRLFTELLLRSGVLSNPKMIAQVTRSVFPRHFGMFCQFIGAIF